MIRGRKAVVEQLVGFVLAFLILMFAWFVIKVAITVSSQADVLGEAGESIGVTEQYQGIAIKNLELKVREVPGSANCDYTLISFLRSYSKSGLTPAEMLSTSLIDFKNSTDSWFELNYMRGNTRTLGWQIELIKQSSNVPVMTTGKIATLNPKFTCTQTVPTPGENYKVKLWLEY